MKFNNWDYYMCTYCGYIVVWVKNNNPVIHEFIEHICDGCRKSNIKYIRIYPTPYNKFEEEA